jgi:hypothetical protein
MVQGFIPPTLGTPLIYGTAQTCNYMYSMTPDSDPYMARSFAEVPTMVQNGMQLRCILMYRLHTDHAQTFGHCHN